MRCPRIGERNRKNIPVRGWANSCSISYDHVFLAVFKWETERKDVDTPLFIMINAISFSFLLLMGIKCTILAGMIASILSVVDKLKEFQTYSGGDFG